MVALTVVIAPTGLLTGVRDALQDLSGAGLVDRFLWIEPRMVDGNTIDALVVDGGRLDGVTLASLAGRERFDVIRVAVLVPALASVVCAPEAVEQKVAQYLEDSFGSTRVTRVRAIVGRVGDTASVKGLVVDGWHNIVLSPEDSTGPGIGSNPLRATTDVLDIGVHAAATLAGLLGLWTGLDKSPLDGEQLLPGRLVRLHRSFYRRLGTAALEDSLRRAVLSTDAQLPLPTDVGQSTVYIENEALATRNMSEQLWTRHEGVLHGERETRAASPYTKVGALEALRMFFSFLGAAIRNAPRSWVVGIVNRVSAHTAAAVQSLVYTSAPSAYEVVVKGVTSDGLPASWADQAEAAATLGTLLNDPGAGEHVVHDDLSALWVDYVAGALTLADAGVRTTGMPPVQIGLRRGILRRAGSIVPKSTATFAGVPPHLEASIGQTTVAPFDVLAASTLGESLRSLAEQASVGRAASTAEHELQAWATQHENSYASQVGRRIGGQVQIVAGEIRGLLAEIRQAASADDLLAGIQAKQRRLAKILQILSIVAVTAVVVTGVLYGLGVLASSTSLLVGGGIVVIWVVSAFAIFVQGQRDLFALINARRELISGQEIAQRNLRHALRDACRLGDAYSQFLAWSTILGEILESPFGHGTGTEKTVELRLENLPLSVGLGMADADPVVLASVAADIRRRIFSVGWLTASWDSAVLNAHHVLGTRGIELQARPEVLFGARGDGDSLLPLWVTALTRSGVDRTIGDDHWAHTLAELTSTRRDLADQLLAHVVDSRNPTPTHVTYEEFMGKLDAPESLDQDRLNDGLLTDSARSTGRSRVVRTFAPVVRSGLGRTVCVSQLSDGIPAYNLLAHAPEEAPSWLTDDAPANGRSGPERQPVEPIPLPDLFNGTSF